jgi:hypothetical protein
LWHIDAVWGANAEANRQAARHRGIVPIIPHRQNAKDPHRPVSKDLYKLRARIEQLIGRLKRFKWIAMRCEKTKRNYASFVAWRSRSSGLNPSTRPSTHRDRREKEANLTPGRLRQAMNENSTLPKKLQPWQTAPF